MSLELFHPAVRGWFESAFDGPTPAQEAAWPAIAAGEPALIAAPTGSGKTLAAFLWAIDELAREAIAGNLGDETRVLYVSPLKALSHDVQKNLEAPLAGISEKLQEQGHLCPEIRAWVRTGDTPQSERERMKRKPPHILVTTPESLYILLTSESGRRMLSTVRTAIVDEIHAVAGTKRGAHLALSLERLAALTGTPPVRVGLSATQKPIERIGRFLAGDGPPCRIVDLGHARERDMALEVPGAPLAAVMSAETMEDVYDRLAELVREHRTTLIFVNTRRLAERAARCLADRLGEAHVTSHHGSLSRQHRLDAEQRLKGGRLRAMVATSSLELGIDIGDVDLVCQLGSPRAISAFLQRVGRSGHAVGATPKGRLFPLSRDDLVECAALLAASRDGDLDQLHLCEGPVDVLAQQVVAEVAAREWALDDLLAVFRGAWPYRDLDADGLLRIVRMLADGFTTRRGRRGAYLHFDAVNGRLRPRRGARLTAITNGGTIPDQFDYDVVMAPQGLRVGTVNEDFAFESLPGDIFQLGNTSYRILKVETGRVLVEDAKGQPPNIPFWFGEAPGRTDELSAAVSTLRQKVAAWLEDGADAAGHLARDYGLPAGAAGQLADYLAAGRAALGMLPTLEQPAMERFFDDAGDQHLVIHSPYGSRINRAWGLALRKRFCRQFNFELQAAADEDHIVLSLGATHSFPLDEVAGYLRSDNARDVLTQALLDAPVFGVRWRWNATIALAVQRMRGGNKLPPPFQRSDAEDLLSVVFPDQLACLENIAGQREIPEHPLVDQTIADCLHEHMDVAGLERLLRALETGAVRIHSRDLTGPSPLAEEILNARPYAFLDDGDAEERRTRNVRTGQYAAPEDAARLGRLDPAAVQRVRDEAWPVVRDPDELHDALVTGGFLAVSEAQGWESHYRALAAERRAARVHPEGGEPVWVAAERLAEWQSALPGAVPEPPIDPAGPGGAPDPDRALVELLRSRLEILGPVTAESLGRPLGLPRTRVETALAALEGEGFAMQGAFTAAGTIEWCARRLLVRIHRYTIRGRRRGVEPVNAAVFMRFLAAWQGLAPAPGEGEETLSNVLGQLAGFALPAGAWEREVLPARVADFEPAQLDRLTGGGRFVWLRLDPSGAASPVKSTPVALVPRDELGQWLRESPGTADLSTPARQVYEALDRSGALFHGELARAAGLLRAQLEQALGELVARGLVTSDAFAGLRALLGAGHRGSHRGRRRGPDPMEGAGRWALLRPPPAGVEGNDEEPALARCRVLLRRYGVVFKRLLARESGLPPWRDLLYWFHRLEARGELRGGRFVDGFSGEQFALPEAAGLLADVRREPARGEWLALSAGDPLNLAGIITPGERVAAQSGNRLVLRDGVPVAWQSGGEVSFARRLAPEAEWQARTRLARLRNPQYLDAPGRSV